MREKEREKHLEGREKLISLIQKVYPLPEEQHNYQVERLRANTPDFDDIDMVRSRQKEVCITFDLC